MDPSSQHRVNSGRSILCHITKLWGFLHPHLHFYVVTAKRFSSGLTRGILVGNTQKVIGKDVTFFFCKNSPPPWFDDSIPGDFGFDPLGLGSDPELLKWFAEAELIHSRWAMLAVSGILIPEWLESLGFIEKFSWYDAGAQEYFADSTSFYIF
ncbi:photosystem I chlorophyll a/b-binding protein 6, chloroplastic-like [Impatiens glandulifera]|uniref:photosystem I chlorophyll a/b-binding protein 6, chloroplastic-like n=1 Tax=Impatiens glandulifera TaxID=253017 RepID=UPI001FB19180|nr:photosystem I chlorophyll a/b-binding protein 6, chloroplastic-like [Impatiens glandulifera]